MKTEPGKKEGLVSIVKRTFFLEPTCTHQDMTRKNKGLVVTSNRPDFTVVRLIDSTTAHTDDRFAEPTYLSLCPTFFSYYQTRPFQHYFQQPSLAKQKEHQCISSLPDKREGGVDTS